MEKSKNTPQKQTLAKIHTSKLSLQGEVYLSVIFYELTSAKERLHHLEGFPAVPESQGQVLQGLCKVLVGVAVPDFAWPDSSSSWVVQEGPRDTAA